MGCEEGVGGDFSNLPSESTMQARLHTQRCSGSELSIDSSAVLFHLFVHAIEGSYSVFVWVRNGARKGTGV